MLRLEMVETENGLVCLAEQWRALAERARDCQISQTYDWCALSWQCLQRMPTDKLQCLTAWEGSALLAVWPFRRRRIGLFRHLYPLGTIDGWNYAEPLLDAACDTKAICEALLKAVSGRGDVLHVHLLKIGSDMHLASGQFGIFRQATRYDTLVVNPHCRGSWEEFMATYSKNMRNQLHSSRKGLSNLGNLTFEIARKSESQTELIDWTLKQKQTWLERREGNSEWLSRPETRAFLIEVAKMRQDVGNFLVFSLKLNNRPIATWMGPVTEDTVGAMMITFDPEFQQFSPGILLIQDVLRWCYHSNRQAELGSTTMEYKERWAPGKVGRETFQFNIGALGGMHFVGGSVKRAVRGRFKSVAKAAIRLKNIWYAVQHSGDFTK